MQKQQGGKGGSQLFNQLMELGFQEEYVRKAVSLTDDIEKASNIALKLADQGPNADLSEFMQPPQVPVVLPKQAEVKIGPFSRAKMLFIVNGELKMGKGKICAQVGHAVIGVYTQIEEEARYEQKAQARLKNWESLGGPKIVVKVQTQKEMLEIKQKLDAQGINTHLVRDAGHTQIKAGSMTVLGIGPVFPEEVDPTTQHLKLL